MSLYDILDTIRDINDEVYTSTVSYLSNNANKVNQLKGKLARREQPIVVVQELHLEQYLTEMEYADLEERLQ